MMRKAGERQRVQEGMGEVPVLDLGWTASVQDRISANVWTIGQDSRCPAGKFSRQ